MRSSSFLDTGLRLPGLIRLCKIARIDINFTKLFQDSEIRYKNSFLKYLNFCLEKNLIENTGTMRTERRKNTPAYKTTESGFKFLEILGENN